MKGVEADIQDPAFPSVKAGLTRLPVCHADTRRIIKLCTHHHIHGRAGIDLGEEVEGMAPGDDANGMSAGSWKLHGFSYRGYPRTNSHVALGPRKPRYPL
jgi:hypothetical protein